MIEFSSGNFLSYAMRSQIIVSIRDSISKRSYPLQVYMSFHDFLCDLSRMTSSNGGLFSEYPDDYFVNIIGYFGDDFMLHPAEHIVEGPLHLREFTLAEFKHLCNHDRSGAPIDRQSNNVLFERFLNAFSVSDCNKADVNFKEG